MTRQWKALAIPAAFLPGLAPAAECERITQISVPSTAAPRAHRPRIARVSPVKRPVFASNSPNYRHVSAKLASKTPTFRQVISRYDCPPLSSLPPGVVPIIPGVPYIGTPPIWGYPPGWVPTSPEPIRPGSPQDFPPGLTIPPAGYPPAGTPPAGHPPSDFPPAASPPTDVPEPPAWTLMLLGLALLLTNRMRRKS